MKKLTDSSLNDIADDAMNILSSKLLNYDSTSDVKDSDELNNMLIRYALNNSSRKESGRLEFPLLWNEKSSHLLSRNYNLSKAILFSNLKKLKDKNEYLHLIDDYFKEQENSQMIEKIHNFDDFINSNEKCSFLPHMPIFKMKRQTTKCRVVFLSNLFEQDLNQPLSFSHNQSMYSGPILNYKLSSALLHLRFDSKVLCFDIKRAFNQIALNNIDQNRLLFLWFRNVKKQDYSIIAYRNLRLPFGLRCSPSILMLALYRILVLDAPSDELKNIKMLIYQLFYMDNGAFTCSSSSELTYVYSKLSFIFLPYGMELQQFITNDLILQSNIDSENNEKSSEEVPLLGLVWNRKDDLIYTNKIQLDILAQTKRNILKSIASQYDLFGFNIPILNRSRIFMHKLQCNKKLDWDTQIDKELQHEWKLICRQANSSSILKVSRFVGNRNSSYKLIACVDSSREMYGVVLYILDIETNKINFLLAKNRIVNTKNETKSIPSLELMSIHLGCEVLLDLYKELAGPKCLVPINIESLEICSDSFVALSWIKSYAYTFDKMQKRTIFVLNRLQKIFNFCKEFPINFKFINGCNNPSDYVTRQISYNKLIHTNYLTGENLICNDNCDINLLHFKLPIDYKLKENVALINVLNLTKNTLFDIENFSSFNKAVRVLKTVIKCFFIWRNKIKYTDLSLYNFTDKAKKLLFLEEQKKHFPEIFEYFYKKCKPKYSIPNIVNQLNCV